MYLYACMCGCSIMCTYCVYLACSDLVVGTCVLCVVLWGQAGSSQCAARGCFGLVCVGKRVCFKAVRFTGWWGRGGRRRSHAPMPVRSCLCVHAHAAGGHHHACDAPLALATGWQPFAPINAVSCMFVVCNRRGVAAARSGREQTILNIAHAHLSAPHLARRIPRARHDVI